MLDADDLKLADAFRTLQPPRAPEWDEMWDAWFSLAEMYAACYDDHDEWEFQNLAGMKNP